MMDYKKLFILDAYALIFRAYYAFISRPIRNSKGINTSAIYGFVTALDEILTKENPSHIAVAFDPPSPTFRHDMYEQYKANRDETPEDIKLSVPYIKRILEAYNIPILEYEGYEADDVIGTVAKIALREGYKVYMMTPDKDFAQLVEEGIYIYKPRRSGNESEIWSVEEVKREFEINNPIQVIDILALWGDASDNIPGAPGIGEKTAKKLIAEYGSVENLLENLHQLKEKQKHTLEAFRDQIILSKKLATIDIHVPIKQKISEFDHKILNVNALREIFSELEFKTLAKKILDNTNSSKAPAQGSLFERNPIENISQNVRVYTYFDPGKVSYNLVSTEPELLNLISLLEEKSLFCFDTETTGLDVLEAEIVGLAISINEFQAWYIPFTENQENSRKILQKLKHLFTEKSILKIGHNLKYDIQMLERYGVNVQGPFFDTMIANYLINPEGKNKLDHLAETMLKYQMIPIEELIGKKGKDQLNMRDIDVNRVKDYACEDADITYRLFNLLVSLIKENELDKLAKEIEMPLIEVLCSMELEGFNLDVQSLKEYELQLEDEIHKTEKEIFSMAGEEFNIASPRQLGVILFEKMKVTSNFKLTKTKQYATSEEVLQQLTGEHPIINTILDYRSLTKLQSTYVTSLPKIINQRTKRIHSSFNQTIAATGRLSSINPNLQNIPIREARGREIRKAFIPSSEDYLLLSADYSQIELRLMAHMSGDEHLIDAFKKGEDIHQATAARIFKISLDEVTREQRSKAKTANFGIIYGISAFGLSQRLNIPRSEAKELIDNYFMNFPKVKDYMENCISEAKLKGYVVTLFGRRRYLPDINSSNSIVRGVAERNAINSPIQGTAADIIKIAMVSIFNRLKKNFKTRMILQVHDELVFNVYKSEIESIQNLVREEMEHAADLQVPLEVELGIGSNWLEAH
jgi:DNA polymerase I